MYISAKVDYATRALLGLAAAGGQPVKAETLAGGQSLPVKFVENILVDLRRHGFVTSQRGAAGGYRLARPADRITIAEVIRALEGPLAEVRGERPEHTRYDGPAAHLQDVWVAVRASLRRVLDEVTLDHVLRGELPPAVGLLLDDPDAWQPR